MKIGIIEFPGSNNYQSYANIFIQNYSLENITPIWHRDIIDLNIFQLIILGGGASYSNLLRPGVLAAQSPIINNLKEYIKNGGYVLAIDNGFQILTEAKILPGNFLINHNAQLMSQKIYLKTIDNSSIFTGACSKKEVIQMHINNFYTRYHLSDKELQNVIKQNQIVFQYCDINNNITEESDPTLSIENIAGIMNDEKNVLGILPRPEDSFLMKTNNQTGRLIFDSIINCLMD